MIPSRRPHPFARLPATALVAALVGLAAGFAPARGAEPPPAASLGLVADDVRHHLGHVIDWYQRLAGLEPNAAIPDDVATRERLHQLMITQARAAFTFGRAAAALVAADVQPPADGADAGPAPAAEMAQYDRIAERMEERAAQLAAGIGALDGALPRATPLERELLEARRAQLAAALRLAREVQSTANGLQQFAARSSSSASGETGLLADISDMERAVPEARAAAVRARQRAAPAAGGAARAADSETASGDAAIPVTAVAAPTTANSRTTGTPGLLALGSEWLDLRSARAQHTHFLDATEELAQALDRLSSRLTQQVRDLLRDGPVTRDSGDAAALAADRATLDATTARFRQLSTLLVPLGEEAITLDNVRSLLAERRGELDSRAAKLGRQFLLRAMMLVASVLLILAISSLWRRATFRYLQDSRRRQQFLTLRRVATGGALVAVLVFAVVSEIGSLATYIGFLTAGLAVALQNVILSVVAYFFLIGRYGVRVGDRVTISGQTGRVVDIGLIRIYLAELAGPELTDTGRMIVLSNAVIFQPSALFKQIPGADYTWHTVNLTLASPVGVDEARDRLIACANDVYATYRETIERRIAAARHLVDFEYEQPEPEIRARYTEGGLALSVRYPVLPDQAAQIDQRMNTALRAALGREPVLELAEGGQPVLAA